MRSAAAAVALLAFPLAVWAAEFRSVAEGGTVMYDAPSVKSKKLFAASRAYPVEIVVSIDNWAKVRDSAGELAWVEKKSLSERRTVVVTAPVADVRQAANDQSGLAFQAQQGVVLEVAESPAGGWVKVRHADGLAGYVRINQIWGV
jgi:SH3-like domain-containing protein